MATTCDWCGSVVTTKPLDISGMLLVRGTYEWRVLAHFIHTTHDGWLLLMSVSKPMDMEMVALADVEELLRQGKLVARCDSLTYVNVMASTRMQEIVDHPTEFLNKHMVGERILPPAHRKERCKNRASKPQPEVETL